MFIELTSNGNKHLLPLSSLSIHQQDNGRKVFVKNGEFELFVEESYETIREMIINLLENENGKVARGWYNYRQNLPQKEGK